MVPKCHARVDISHEKWIKDEKIIQINLKINLYKVFGILSSVFYNKFFFIIH